MAQDTIAATVREHFEDFLVHFSSEAEQQLPPSENEQQPGEYVEQVCYTLWPACDCQGRIRHAMCGADLVLACASGVAPVQCHDTE